MNKKFLGEKQYKSWSVMVDFLSRKCGPEIYAKIKTYDWNSFIGFYMDLDCEINSIYLFSFLFFSWNIRKKIIIL